MNETTMGGAGPARRAAAKPTWHAYLCRDREALIAAMAYELARKRHFAPGHALDDWLAAEADVDERLIGEGREF